MPLAWRATLAMPKRNGPDNIRNRPAAKLLPSDCLPENMVVMLL